jgi:L-fuconolactonase
MRIDAHIHFWRPDSGFDNRPIADHPAYRRDFLPPDIEGELARCGIEAVILVQAAPQADETAWMLELARHHPIIAGVVGWVDLDAAPIDYVPLCANRSLVGIRAQLRRIADPEFVLRPRVLANVGRAIEAGLGVTLLTEERHYAAVERALHSLPPGPVTFNHLGMRCPEVDRARWRNLMRVIVERPATYLQLSGLPFLHGEHWREPAARSILDEAYEIVGPGRLVFASDWPMLIRFATCTDWLRAAEALLHAHGATAAQSDAVFCHNAMAAHPRLVAPGATASAALFPKTENAR